MRIRRALASVTATGVLAVGVIVASGSPASADRCPSTRSPRIDGGTARWTYECDLGDLKVYGWVDDTRTDGKCAVVRIDPDAGTTREFEACGSGTRETFSVTFDHINSAQTKLFLR